MGDGNFWSTWDVYAVCAGFKYQQYLDQHPGPGAPLSHNAYKLLNEVINVDMEDRIE